MVGQRHKMDSVGDSYEAFAESVLSRIAAITQIATKKDFGADRYCQPRIKAGENLETITELCLLQVKGGKSRLEYGGLDSNGKWKEYELDWLRTLWAPFYLATVDAKYERVDVYSLWPVWWVLWQSRTPAKIVFKWREDVGSKYEFVHPTRKVDARCAGCGDGHRWAIDLGVPILRLTHQNLNDENFRVHAVEIFRHWIQVDRVTVARFHTQLPVIDANWEWRTNEIPYARQELLAIDGRPGANIKSLSDALARSLLGLGAHLQHQNNPDAFRLIPLLEWLKISDSGTLITPQLHEELTRAQRDGVGPATYL